MEHADHAKEAARENRTIALLIAVIALCLALSETLGKEAQNEAISRCRSFRSMGVLPGQNNSPHCGADDGRAIQVPAWHDNRRHGQGCGAKADRELAEDGHDTVPSRKLAKGLSSYRRVQCTPRKSAICDRNIIISSSALPRSRSQSCLLLQPSSRAYSHWPGSPAYLHLRHCHRRLAVIEPHILRCTRSW